VDELVLADGNVAEGHLSLHEQALVHLAAAIAAGGAETIDTAARIVAERRVSGTWVDELLLQSVLMVGYPRTLVAAGVWRRVSGTEAPGDDPGLHESAAVWRTRGERTCRLVYRDNYERLRANVRRLHPALDDWMVVEGYGRVLSRPGLPLRLRELCTVAQVSILDTPHQLHSHLRGALHAGARPAELDEVLAIADPMLTAPARTTAGSVWRAVRERWSERG